MQITDTCILVIRHLIKSRDENDVTQYYPDLSVHIPDYDSVDVYLLPNILLWDPLMQIPNCPKLVCPHCKNDGIKNSFLSPIATSAWELGQYNNRIPRKIWDKAWFCALVGKVYGCKRHHQLVSYHAGILNQLQSYQVPFILSHGSGMTTAMFDSILRLVDDGNSFCKVESILAERVRETFAQRKLLNPGVEFPLIEKVFKTLAPRDNFIRKCYISNYERNSWKYYKEMEKVSCESLNCDLTFQTAAKIGFRQDKKWITMYDSVYIITNEIGQVKYYVLSKGTSFDHVYDAVRTIAFHQTDVTRFYLHDCCNWREKLSDIFPKVQVKLNLQHAINFLKENLPSKSSHYSDVCHDLEMVFRAEGDTGQERTLPTPSPEVIMGNVEAFLENWDTTALKRAVLKEQFFMDLQKLQEHIVRGCVSDIPPGHCMELCVNLQKQMRNVLNTISLGVQTAHALMSSVIYFHNRKKAGETIVPPIWSLDEYHTEAKETPTQLHLITENIAKEIIEDNCVGDIVKVESLMEDTEETELKTEHGYSVPHVALLIKKVVNLARILHKIDSKMDKALSERLYRHQELCTLPTEIWASTSYLRLCRLTNVVTREVFIPFIQSIGFYEHLLHPQDRAVDSFLASISLSLMSLIQQGNLPSEYVEALRLSGIKENGKIIDTSYALIPVLHNELVNGQRDIYEVVLAGDNLDRQAENMLKGAGISTSLRDTLPLVVANALNLMVIIIPMSQGLPLLPVFPENAVIIDDPIFLLFENSENGRYSAISFDDLPEPQVIPILSRCRCGANDKKIKKRCGAGIRCSCRANNTTCSHKCGCIGCTNGKPKKTISKRRKRFHESLSQHPSIRSYDAAFQYGEAIPGTPINAAQHFLLEANLYAFLCETKTVLKNLEDDYVAGNIFTRYVDMCNILGHFEDSRNKGFVDRLGDSLEREAIYRWVRSRKKKENLVIEFNSACALEEVTICGEDAVS